MKKQIMFLSLAGILFYCSCQKEQFSDKEISSNLLKMGTDNPELLTGEWKPFKFSYTEDGNKISDVAMISSDSDYTVKMYDESVNPYAVWNDERLGPIFFLTYSFSYSRTGNLIKNIPDELACDFIMIFLTDDELKASQALINAFSYVIVDDELIIYFKNDKNQNLLILKKCNS